MTLTYNQVKERHADLFNNQNFGISFGEGWADIVDKMCCDLRPIFELDDRLSIDCIKEKFGTLRVYGNHYAHTNSMTCHIIEIIINEAIGKSGKTCHTCGSEKGVVVQSIGGWLLAACEPCKQHILRDREQLI